MPAAISNQLKFGLIAAVCVFFVLLAVGAWDARQRRLAAAERDATATIAVLRAHALEAIETHELLIRSMDRRIAGMTWEQIRASAPLLSAEMRAMVAGMPQVSTMALTDSEGRTWVRSPPLGADQYGSIANLDAWRAQRDADQGTYISPAFEDPLTEQLDFGISRRRGTAGGSFDGTVHVVVAASYFTDLWSRALSGWNGVTISLVRDDGELLARFPDGDGPRRLTAETSPLMRHLTVAPSEGSFRAVPSIDGVERIFAYGKLGNYPLVISYTVAVRTVLAPWRWHVMIFGGAGLAAGLAVIVLALAAIKQSGRLADERASRATLEQAVLQAKRLELLGQVAAGTAHDFANILQAMRNGLTLIKHRAAQPDRVRFLADRLDEDARRGTSLTQRMLDLAHQDEPETAGDGLVSPAEVLGRVDEMLCRLLGSQYRLRCEIASADLPGSVRGDRAGLEVALMNLAINARDAMPGGGEVVIRATAEQAGDGVRASGKASGPGSGVADGEPNRPASARGGYVCISVIDTGIGMPPHVLSRAGEPFFTTKPRGRGTGLGLSGARAFAERAGGWLSIESAAGCGTTVALWLPVVVPCRAVETEPAEPMV